MKRRWLPLYVTACADRHGKMRYRFRRKGFANYQFKSALGTEGFRIEYAACLTVAATKPTSIVISPAIPGTINDLIIRYYGTPSWRGMQPSSQRTYRGIIERFRKAHGDKPVAAVEARHLDAILGKMADKPAAANNLRKVLKRLFSYAVKSGMRPHRDNPADLTDSFKMRGEGFHTWTETEIQQFESYFEIRTKARLAMALMLHTGLRRSDVVRLGPQHVQNGRIRITQTKTGAPVTIPINSELRATIDANPSDSLVFLVTQFGKPFTSNGFGNWFRDRCNEAGLPQCSAHGLRKAMSRRLAEAGVTNLQGRAVTGHKTDRMFEHYAAEANKEQLADAAMANLEKQVRHIKGNSDV
jgi:integrase